MKKVKEEEVEAMRERRGRRKSNTRKKMGVDEEELRKENLKEEE